MNIYRNSYEIATTYGEKCFELHQGDILQFDEKIDVLVVSAFIGDYQPFPKTLIGALKNQAGISVEQLSKRPFIDMRDEKGVWVSQKLCNKPFQYIVCVEFLNYMIASTDSEWINERLKNLFLCLEMLDKFTSNLRAVAMPLIGTGSQKIAPALVLSILFQHGATSLKRCSSFNKIYIIEQKEEKVAAISQAMDQVLKREGQQVVNVFRDKESRETFKNIEKLLQELILIRNKRKINKTFAKMMECIRQEEVRYLDLAILSRRTVELMLREINPELANRSLYRKIEDFSRKQVAATWIISYMHIIRILGNEQAHDDINRGRIPGEIMVTDQRIMLHCLEQLFTFWIQYEKERKFPGNS